MSQIPPASAPQEFTVGLAPGSWLAQIAVQPFIWILYNLIVQSLDQRTDAHFLLDDNTGLIAFCVYQIPYVLLLVWWVRRLLRMRLVLRVEHHRSGAKLTAEFRRGKKVTKALSWDLLHNATVEPSAGMRIRPALTCYQDNGEPRRIFAAGDNAFSIYDLTDTQTMEKLVQAIGPLPPRTQKPMPPDPELEVQPEWDEAAGKP